MSIDGIRGPKKCMRFSQKKQAYKLLQLAISMADFDTTKKIRSESESETDAQWESLRKWCDEHDPAGPFLGLHKSSSKLSPQTFVYSSGMTHCY